jgi:HAD superfamily hydrolase (TIGR01490 family)
MKNIVFFDIDDTLVRGQSQLLLVKYLFKRRKVSFFFLVYIIFWFVFYRLGLIKNPKVVMEKSFLLLKNWNIKDFDNLVESFVNEIIAQRVNEKIYNKLLNHQQSGDEIVIITNVMEPLAKVIANFFKVNILYSTQLEINNEKYTGKIQGEIVYGETKAKNAQEFLSGLDSKDRTTSAYADHLSDRYLLELVDKPHVVNPKKKFRDYAIIHSWEIIE